MKLEKIVHDVVALVEKINKALDAELPKKYPEYPFVKQGEDVEPLPKERELRNYLSKLSPDVVYNLTLLMYLGRGDFGADNLQQRKAEIKERFPKPEWAVSQMAGKAPLGEYLEHGVELLRDKGVTLEDLSLTSVAARKKHRRLG
jgi:hypothetical protein